MQGEQLTLEHETKYIERMIKKITDHKMISLIVECDKEIAGHVTLGLKTPGSPLKT